MDSVRIDLQSGHAGAGYECLDEISKSCYLKRPKNDTTVMRLHSDHKISVIKNLTANTILAVLSVISKSPKTTVWCLMVITKVVGKGRISNQMMGM